jgi:hypothetical protein
MNSGIRTTLFFTVFRRKHGLTLSENNAGMTQHEREQSINSQIFPSLKGKIRLSSHVEFGTLEKMNSSMPFMEQTLGKSHEHIPRHFPQNGMNHAFDVVISSGCQCESISKGVVLDSAGPTVMRKR